MTLNMVVCVLSLWLGMCSGCCWWSVCKGSSSSLLWGNPECFLLGLLGSCGAAVSAFVCVCVCVPWKHPRLAKFLFSLQWSDLCLMKHVAVRSKGINLYCVFPDTASWLWKLGLELFLILSVFICYCAFYGPDGTMVVTCIADAIWPKWWCKSPPSVSVMSLLNICFLWVLLPSLLELKLCKIDMVKGKT